MNAAVGPGAEDLVDLHTAAAILGLSHWTIRRRIANGDLPGYRFGPRTLRVRRSQVLALGTPVPSAARR